MSKGLWSFRVIPCNKLLLWNIDVWQQLSTTVPQEFLKHAVPDYLVRDINLFSLNFQMKQWQQASSTITIWSEWIKIIPIFLSDRWKIYFLVCCRILVISLWVPWDEKSWKLLMYGRDLGDFSYIIPWASCLSEQLHMYPVSFTKLQDRCWATGSCSIFNSGFVCTGAF